jgi:2-methylcitrate dehydratase PrpD
MSTNSLGREYHAGFAATSGIMAPLVAQRGYTGDLSILEAPRGYLNCFHSKVPPESVVADLGKDWDICTDLMIKLRPGAHPLSAAVEAAINAARQGNVDPATVVSIVASGPRLRAMIGHKHPKDLVGAIHSLAYYLASAVADKDFNWSHATPEKIADPVIDRLQDLVEVDPSPPGGLSQYTWGWGATVTITMRNGTKYSSTVNAPVGSGPRGIEWNDVDAKYRALVPESGLAQGRIEESLALIHRFDEVTDVGELTRLLRV